MSEQRDLLTPLPVGSLPRDEISLVGERSGGKGPTIAPIPSVDHLLMDTPDRVLVSGVKNAEIGWAMPRPSGHHRFTN